MERRDTESIPGLHVNRDSLSTLTCREVEILKWCAAGKTAAEIGTILDLKCRTVNFHVGRAIQKLGVSNKTQAAVQAALSGILVDARNV
jgi:LuxR family transcriptional regulator